MGWGVVAMIWFKKTMCNGIKYLTLLCHRKWRILVTVDGSPFWIPLLCHRMFRELRPILMSCSNICICNYAYLILFLNVLANCRLLIWFQKKYMNDHQYSLAATMTSSKWKSFMLHPKKMMHEYCLWISVYTISWALGC